MDWKSLAPDDPAERRLGRARWLRARLDRLPKIDVAHLDATRAAHHEAVGKLADRLAAGPDPARFRHGPLETAVAMMGIRASSTGGLAAALANWCAAVDRRHGRATAPERDTELPGRPGKAGRGISQHSGN